MSRPIWRSYLICGVQRTGSTLLCYRLEDTGVAGHPGEPFLPAIQEAWTRERSLEPGVAPYLISIFNTLSTPNGVWGAKMMWNYFHIFLGQLQLHMPNGGRDDAMLHAAFPGLKLLWIRRQDKLRQAVSWWRAAATGQYGLAADAARAPWAPTVVAPAPPVDRHAIEHMRQLAIAYEDAWGHWFASHNIRPLEVEYEELTERPESIVRQVLAFLEVQEPDPLPLLVPPISRQADSETERLIAEFLRR